MNNMLEGKKHLLVTLLTTGAATLLAFAINFFVTPFITEILGVEAYGFVSLANTFIGYAGIVTTALDSFATRYIAIEYHKGNAAKAEGYLSSLFFANLILSIGIFLIMLPLCLNPSVLLDVPPELSSDVSYLFILAFSNFLVLTASSSFSAAAYIKNRLDYYGVFQTLSYLVEAAFLVFVYTAFSPHTWYFGLALFLSSIVLLFGNLYLYKRFIPELKVSLSFFSWTYVRDLFSVGVWSSINSLGNTLNSGIGLLVANVLLSSVAMGQLAIAKTFSTVFTRLYQLVSQAYYPMILKAYSENNMGHLLNYFKQAMNCTGSIAAIMFAGFFALCPAFYSLWVPSQDVSVLYPLTMLVMVYALVEGPVQPLYYVYALTLKNKFPTVVTVIGGILNVLLMIPLVTSGGLGVFGVPLVTAIVMVIISFITNPLYMSHCLGVSPLTFYPPIMRAMTSCIVCCLVFEVTTIAINPASWISFILAALICLVFGVAICLLIGLDSDTRNSLISRFRRVRSR